MKTIVAHLSVDLDAVAAIWLIKRFFPGWKDSEIVFIPAGTTLNDMPVDSKPEIIHVDTGCGRFDHHRENTLTSATQKVFEYAKENLYVKEKVHEAMHRLVTFVTSTDHFLEIDFPDPTNDRYDFCLHQLTKGLSYISKNDEEVVSLMLPLLDAALQILINKVKAETEIQQGYFFKSSWGRTLAIESSNEETMKLAQKQGYVLVVRRDPKRGFVRIKISPRSNLLLNNLYERLKKADKKASWFLHVSGRMLLNGSANNPALVPTNLTLPQVIEIVKKL